MIKLLNLEKIYYGAAQDVHALKDINLHIEKGEIFGIIGKSGAGKSTLIRCINMLERPTKGSVTVDGENLSNLSKGDLRRKRQKIGMIFQHFNILSARTVFENVAFPLELVGMKKEEISARVLPLLELVELSDKKDMYPAELSGGQKQRVGIARALANDPKVLLCDEATSALDPQTTKSILALLKDINKKLKLTIVLITHEMQVVKEICHKVAVIEDGSIIEQGTAIDIFTKPQTNTTKEFIKAIINHEIPELINNLPISDKPSPDSNLLLRLNFIGPTTNEPVITDIIRKFDVCVNILYGNIDYFQETLFGTLIVEISGQDGNIQNALENLRQRELGLEVIGYVPRHDATIN